MTLQYPLINCVIQSLEFHNYLYICSALIKEIFLAFSKVNFSKLVCICVCVCVHACVYLGKNKNSISFETIISGNNRDYFTML